MFKIVASASRLHRETWDRGMVIMFSGAVQSISCYFWQNLWLESGPLFCKDLKCLEDPSSGENKNNLV
jgi:hypothetical protein